MDTATGKLVATKEESDDVDLSESETGVKKMYQGNPLLMKQLWGHPIHPVNQAAREDQKLKKDRMVTQPTRVSNHNSSFGTVFLIVREIYGREHDDPMKDLDVNMVIWGTYLNATLQKQFILAKTTR